MIAQYSCVAPFLQLLLLLLALQIAAQLINCEQLGPSLVSPAEARQQQQLGDFTINSPPPEEPPASSVWFQANNLNSNHIDPRHEQPSSTINALGPRLEGEFAHQISEHTQIPHPNGRVAHRAELGRLERRVDRLEFELRKSLHQIQLLKNDGPAARASGFEDPSTSYQQQFSGNRQAPSHLGPGDKDDQQERRTSSSASSGGTILSSGGNSDIKLIDLSERLNLVEKFITITTSKMYEMEQSLRQLERCECRLSCKWSVPHAHTSTSSSSTSRAPNEQEELYSHTGVAQHKTQLSSVQLETMAPRHPDYYSPMNETITQQQRDHVLKSDGQIWQDERNKCNVCSCHRGHVGCKRVACPALKCDNPQQVPGKCCPVCLKSCTFKQRLVKHGHKLVINSNEQTCKECLCSDGRLKCQRVDQTPPASRMQRNVVDDDLYDGMYDDEYDDPEAVDSRASSLGETKRNDQYDGSNDLDANEDEDEPSELDLKNSNGPTARRRVVGLVKREASVRTKHSIRRNKRTGRRSRGERANELEENDRPNEESDHSTSTAKLPRAGPLFCPLVDCELRNQFKLENDCCTYCRGFDFCAYDFHRTWSTAHDPAASKFGPSSSLWSRRCHPNAKCTNTNIYETLLSAGNNNNSSSNSSEPTGRKLTINSMFACECATGFTGDGTNSCEDIDECAAAHLNDCDPKTTRCVNTPGSYECQCRAGFKPLPHSQLAAGHRKRMVPVVQAGERRLLQRCADANECSDGKLNGCHTQARCVNTPGSYRCHCKRGYLGNGFECHKWFSSGPNVAAYLHRHEDGPVQAAQLRLATESGNLALARVALPPLNTLDEDDEQDDDRSDWPASGGSDLDSRADYAGDQLENLEEKPASPRLSESKWEPLKFGFDSFNSAEPDSKQQLDQQQNSSPTANETERANEWSSSSLNTRTMFFQPPPPMPRPRPWWDEPTTTTTTTTTTATTTTATTTEPSSADAVTDVTEKQTTRLEGPDAKLTAAAGQQSTPNQSDIMRTDPASSSLSKQGGAITFVDGNSAQARPATSQQATTRQPPSGAPRRGTIIASASITPRRGGSPSNGRAYLSPQQQQHYKASSAAAPSLLTSFTLIGPIGVHPFGIHTILQLLTTPTAAAATILTLLVLLFGQQLFCMQINHIVTVYSF